MLDSAANAYSLNVLTPAKEGHLTSEVPVNLAQGAAYPKGTVLGQVAASASEVQTLTMSGSPTGGTFALALDTPTGVGTTAALAYNESAANVQAAIQSVVGSGNATVSGSAGGPWTVTFAGALANRPIAPMVADITLLTGGTPALAVARSTVGATAGTFKARSATVVSAPAAPTVAGNGSGSSWADGAYLVQTSFVTATGETTASPATAVTVTAGQNLRVSAYSSVNSAITKARFYVNGILVAEAAISSGNIPQTDLTGPSATLIGTPPEFNSSGLRAACILRYDCYANADGEISVGSLASKTGYFGQTYPATSAFVRGVFRSQDLAGLDAAALNDLGGRLESGSLSSGIVRIGC